MFLAVKSLITESARSLSLTIRSWQCTTSALPTIICLGAECRWGETAEHAVIREVEEELNIAPEIIRPLWLNQGFFTEDVDKLNYHEICIYYLMDVSKTGLLEKGERFTLREGHHIHDFEWLAFERLQNEYFYPVFLKTSIFDLPEQFTIRTEYE